MKEKNMNRINFNLKRNFLIELLYERSINIICFIFHREIKHMLTLRLHSVFDNIEKPISLFSALSMTL